VWRGEAHGIMFVSTHNQTNTTMKCFISSLFLLPLFSCISSDEEEFRKSMMPHWYLYEPRISEGFSLPVGDINWFADETVPARLQEGLVLASQEWRRVMGCSFTPHKQTSPENMHIHFSCPSDFPPVFGPGSTANLQVDDAGVAHVTLRDDYCKHGRESVAQYAWSHALGFKEKPNLLAPVMNGFDATAEALFGLGPHHIESRELDGLRIWAKSQGSMGCSEGEPNWSWVDYPPGYYYANPTEADVKAWLAMTPEERQKSDILHRDNNESWGDE